MTPERRNELVDKALEYQQTLRAVTKDMTNEERVFFLTALSTGINAALTMFKAAPPDQK